MRKIIGVLIVGLLMATIIPATSALAQETQEKQTAVNNSHIFGVGLFKLDNRINELTGYVIFGILDGQPIFLQNIDIHYTGSPLIGGLLPVMCNLYFTYA
jgi:hypothetical protein